MVVLAGPGDPGKGPHAPAQHPQGDREHNAPETAKRATRAAATAAGAHKGLGRIEWDFLCAETSVRAVRGRGDAHKGPAAPLTAAIGRVRGFRGGISVPRPPRRRRSRCLRVKHANSTGTSQF